MNINSLYSAYGHTTTSTYARTNRSGEVKTSAVPALGWDITDTVEISGGGLQIRLDENPFISDLSKSADFSAEDLAELKERFAALAERRKSIASSLRNMLRSSGIDASYTEELKIEIGSDGKCIVGGISDAKKAKKLENAINGDKALLEEIQAFQKEEAAVSRELRSITGKSLNNYSDRIDSLQKGGGMDSVQRDGAGNMYTLEDCLALRDEAISWVDNEFAFMITDYIGTRHILGADVSGTNNILEDADHTVQKKIEDIIVKVQGYLDAVNKSLRMQYTDPEELKEHLVSLKDIVINVSSNGLIDIEGSFCENFDTNRMVTKKANEIFEEELQYNPYTGRKADFYVAAEYLENQYDLAFKGVDKDRMLVTTYRDGTVTSRISSPEEEERLREEISVQAREALFDLGIAAEHLEIEVNDKGKITVANMPLDEAQAARIGQALKMLNMSTENRSNQDYNNLDTTLDAVGKLKGLLAKLDVFLPGGTALLKGMRTEMNGE